MSQKPSLVPTDLQGYAKDPSTGAVVAIDKQQLSSYRAHRERMKQCDVALKEIESLREELEKVKAAFLKVAEHVGLEVDIG